MANVGHISGRTLKRRNASVDRDQRSYTRLCYIQRERQVFRIDLILLKSHLKY